MDSLLASYASDDDEDAGGVTAGTSVSNSSDSRSSSRPPPLPPTRTTFASGEKPSLFSSVPPPKSGGRFPSRLTRGSPSADVRGGSGGSMFDSLPLPKEYSSLSNPLSLETKPVRASQLSPAVNSDVANGRNRDEGVENVAPAAPKGRSPGVSVGIKLLSTLPAPKSMLGLGSNSSRKSSVDVEMPTVASASFPAEPRSDVEGYQYASASFSTEPAIVASSGLEGHQNSSLDANAYNYAAYNYVQSYDNHSQGYENHGTGSYYTGYEQTTSDVSGVTAVIPEVERVGGKRGRNEAIEIVEVNQAELMKNRPRQDTSSLTGLTYGPAYQSAPSGREKPSKLHKRKHQIGSLFFDMKQKERELAERRASGVRTKAETQGKYGW